jgi:tetratricopeptide (TPR) repeat protein
MYWPSAILKPFAGLLLLVCTHLHSYAQSAPVDSLNLALGQSKNDTNRVLILRHLAAEYINISPQKASECLKEAYVLADELKFYRGTAWCYDTDGNLQRRNGNYIAALEKHFMSLHINDSMQYTKASRNTLSNIGSDYFLLKNYDKALHYFNRSLAMSDTADHMHLIRIYNNIGNTYSFTKQYSKAIQTYLKALVFIDEDKTLRLHATLYSSIATAYAQLDDFDKAIAYMEQALHYQKLTGSKGNYTSSCCTLAGFYIELRNFKKARYYLNEANKTAEEIEAKQSIAPFYYRNMAHLHFREGNFAKAYDYLVAYTEANDSLISKEHIAQMAEMESRYEVGTKNKALELLNKEKSLNESELKRARLWKLMLAGILGLVVGLLLLTYRNMQLKKKTNRLLQLENKLAADAKKDLEQQNTRLQHETVLAQYEILKNQVNPHFLFNSLNALSSLIKTDAEKAQQFTTVFSRLYRSVLELKDRTVITLAEELQLADDYIYLQKIRFGESLKIDKHIQATQMNLFVPPFCIQMMIENAIKHNIVSAEQPLSIKIYSEENAISISNNIQRRVVRDESTGTGIRNIIERFSYISESVPSFTIANEQYIATIPLIAEHL